MSKYKAGDKFVVEINEVMESNNGTLYRANFSTLVFDDYGLDNLSQLGEAKGTYEDGLADAWEAALTVAKHDKTFIGQPFIDIYGEKNGMEVINNLAPQEAIAKIKAYEDSKKIRRGDEVSNSGLTSIVVRVCLDAIYTITTIGTTPKYTGDDIERLTKTGRNFADKLDALLGEIGG